MRATCFFRGGDAVVSQQFAAKRTSGVCASTVVPLTIVKGFAACLQVFGTDLGALFQSRTVLDVAIVVD